MIARLHGVLLAKQPEEVVVDCHGVGYRLLCPLSTFLGLPEVGESAALFVHGSVFIFLLSGVAVVLGRAVDSWPNFSLMFHHINSGVLLGVSAWVLRATSSYLIEPTAGLGNLITAIIVGIIFTTLLEILKNLSMKWYY